MNLPSDNIELLLPFKAEYVSIARLASSGISTRIGFDMETIEDIKVAIAEVCNKLVKTGSETAKGYKITFKISEKKLTVVFDCEDKTKKCIFTDKNEELGVSIINALMDEVEFCPFDSYLLSMSKTLEGND